MSLYVYYLHWTGWIPRGHSWDLNPRSPLDQPLTNLTQNHTVLKYEQVRIPWNMLTMGDAEPHFHSLCLGESGEERGSLHSLLLFVFLSLFICVCTYVCEGMCTA